MKLKKDFGVTALFGTLIIIGVFVLLGIAVVGRQVSFSEVLPVLGAWVGSIVTAYFVIKGTKNGQGQPPPTNP